ncbi:MAG: response regulator transcription factor [Faecalibacterium sp.]|jgi:DNA-binding response OmpR family regulator|nr:response regulator transcription factor [Faecalibacterium sp.]
MALILVAEDEENINRLICKNLALVGHTPLSAPDGEQAITLSNARRPDLMLLDVMLPKFDGFAVKQAVPDTLPVIFVTAKASLPDKLMGLGLGAEDYIVKPFEMLELLARVQTVLRRAGKNASAFVWHELRVDLAARRVFRAGAEIFLTPQEYSLLETLILNRNLALSREKLLESAWGYDYTGETRTVDNHIQHLRKKLGLEQEIQTVYKLGYRLTLRE